MFNKQKASMLCGSCNYFPSSKVVIKDIRLLNGKRL